MLFAEGIGEPTPQLRVSQFTTQRYEAGQDATDTFFSLHRHEVLLRPQYARLQIGKIQGQEETIKPLLPGQLSKVPYAEASWLSNGFFTPYYSDNHRKFHSALRKFLMQVVQPEAIRCEENGKRISQQVVDQMAYVFLRRVFLT